MGPSLQLNITTPGQQKVEQSVSAVERLAAALRDLPKASAELLKLQAALNGTKAPSGLKGGAGDLKELVGEIKNLGAQLNTSFGSLEETIKKGWGKAAKAQAEGEASLRTGNRRGRTVSYKTPEMLEPKEVDLATFAKLQVGSVKLAEAAKAAAEREANSIEAAAARVEAATQRADARLAARFAKRYEREEQDRIKLQVNSSKMAEASRLAAEKEAGAILAAAEKVVAAQRAADAKYAAMSLRGQARTVLGARSALDAGVSTEKITGSFGPQALAAAQATDFASAMSAVHSKAATAHAEVDKGAPKFKLLSASMNDAHSAARGLASGFGAMFLTWGNIGPLLAGAALSHSFVQSLKIGVAVRQDLETMRVLSQESTTAIADLEKQLISLGESGPYGPRQVAEAMKVLSLAGLGAQQVASALKPALDLAVVGGTTIEKSASALVAVGTAYGYQAESFGLVSDAMAKAAAISMSSVDGMMESFRSASVVGQQYKVSLNDTATALAVLANVGIRNSAAGTSIRQMYSELSGASSQTRKAMKDLGVSVIDSVNGGMKPLLTIIKDVDQALSTKTPEAYQRAIQNMSNERGAKSLVALLEAFSASAKEAGSTVPRELERIQKAIADAPGFSAIASAQLAATPLKQLESVASSFQTALFKAFTAVEPTILVISARLKEIFSGADFQSLVSSLAVSVGNMAVFLVEHIGLLKNIVIGYALWKGAAIGLAAANAAVAGATALVNAYKLAMDRVALSAAVAAGGARAAWMAFLGPIGVALGVASAAWALYSATSAQASASGIDAARVRTDVTLKSLDEEIIRLDKVNAEMRKGIGLRAAEASLKAADDKRASIKEYTERAAVLEPLLQKREGDLAKEQGRLDSGKTSSTSARDAAKAARDRVYGQLLATYKESDRVANLTQAKMDEVSEKSAYSAELAARRAQESAKKFGPEGIPESPAKLKAGINADGKQVRSLQSEYEAQQALAQKAHDREMTLLNMRHKAKVISEESYTATAEMLSEDLYTKEIQNLANFISASAAEMQRLRGTRGGEIAAKAIEVEYEKAITKFSFETTKIQLAAELRLRKPLVADKSARAGVDELMTNLSNFQKELPRVDTEPVPAWKKNLAEWESARKVLETSRDNFMNGWVERGRSMWGEFLKTGKLSMKSLGDLVMDTLADITYKRFISQPFAKAGEALFDNVLKSTLAGSSQSGGVDATGGVETAVDSYGGLSQTLSNLRTTAGDLGTSFANLGSSAWDMLAKFAQGLAATLSSSGGSGGGWASAIASLFTGGGGNMSESYTGQDAFAKGGAFYQGVHAFATGGVVDRPHYFKFGKGGANLGVMGEAGPEAILPLARGADGNLGVRTQGGGGATNVTVASKTTVVIENHGGGPEPEVQTQTQPNGDEMIRVVIKAAAKDMSTGGPLRKATRSSSSYPRY